MFNHCKKCNKKLKSQKRKFCSVSCSNRFNLNNKKQILIKKEYLKELAELFGILLGDGSVTKYYTRIYLNQIADKGYSTHIIKIINQIFPKIKITTKYRNDRGTEELQISSKIVSDYFFELGFNPKERIVPEWITEDFKLSKATLRGLFDTEGSMSIKKINKNNQKYLYKQLTFTNKNKALLIFTREMIIKLRLNPSKSTGNNIYISNKKDINTFFKKIGTKNPKLEKKYKIE